MMGIGKRRKAELASEQAKEMQRQREWEHAKDAVFDEVRKSLNSDGRRACQNERQTEFAVIVHFVQAAIHDYFNGASPGRRGCGSYFEDSKPCHQVVGALRRLIAVECEYEWRGGGSFIVRFVGVAPKEADRAIGMLIERLKKHGTVTELDSEAKP